MDWQKIGMLTVKPFHIRKPGGVYWLCQCKCGKTKMIKEYDLKNNLVKSCGCLNVHTINFYGEHRSIKGWADEFGISPGTMRNRVRRFGDTGAIKYSYSRGKQYNPGIK